MLASLRDIISSKTSIKYSIIKIAEILAHTCSKPVKAEYGYNSGMFNELCAFANLYAQAFIFFCPLGVSYMMLLQLISHSLRRAENSFIRQSRS